MKLTRDDQQMLQELCDQHEVSFEKILKFLDTVREYEFKDRRTGIYDALREILTSNPAKSSKKK